MTIVLSLSFPMSLSLSGAPPWNSYVLQHLEEGPSPSTYTCPALNLPSSSPVSPNAQPGILVEPSQMVSRKPGGVQVRWEGDLWRHSQVPTSILDFKVRADAGMGAQTSDSRTWKVAAMGQRFKDILNYI